MTTTKETITPEQIHALRNEASEHGDNKQVEICDRALNGDADATAICAGVIAYAEGEGR